jgi:hypothetical protein
MRYAVPFHMHGKTTFKNTGHKRHQWENKYIFLYVTFLTLISCYATWFILVEREDAGT